MSLHSLFVDFNSYFTSVEQHVRPELRGRPVAVVPMMVDSTCALAASYEAKRFGVKTGTNLREAREKCPGIVFVLARHELYIHYHHQLVKAVDSCLPVEAVHSIDEMVCLLDRRHQQREKAVELARKVKRAIAAQVGETFRCSVGLAPNGYLAKTATDMQKPDGLVVIERADLPHILHPLKLRDLCGIGRNMEQRLRAKGITTVEQLCAARKETLRAVWNGVEGERMWELLRGNPVPRNPTERSTVGHSHVLPPEQRNDDDACAVLSRLLQKAAHRLRNMGYVAGALSVSLKYPGGGHWDDALHFNETSDTIEFLHALKTLWSRRPPELPGPLAVGVALHRLMAREFATGSLFPEGKNRERLNAVVDSLQQKFGKRSAYFGGAHTAMEAGGPRIAFHHVPDLELEHDDSDLDGLAPTPWSTLDRG